MSDAHEALMRLQDDESQIARKPEDEDRCSICQRMLQPREVLEASRDHLPGVCSEAPGTILFACLSCVFDHCGSNVYLWPLPVLYRTGSRCGLSLPKPEGMVGWTRSKL